MDDWEVFEWLIDEGGEGGTYRGVAAALLCVWLEAIVDGERAIGGGHTDLPRPEGMTDEQFRLTILDIDREKWDWVTQVVEGGPLTARDLVNKTREESAKDDWHIPGHNCRRDAFTAFLRGVVGFYAQRRRLAAEDN